MTVQIHSLSLACRVVLDMHALNNEGNESNRLMTRQVGIVTPVRDAETDSVTDYRRDVVNAISGDMYKHIFADVYRHIALDMNSPVCEACRGLDPARMMGDPKFVEFVREVAQIKPVPPIDKIIDRLLDCAVDDVCGIMITAGTSVKRKSAIEFGWSVGLPEITEVAEFIHARHAVTRLTRTKAGRDSDAEQKAKAADEKGQNIGQMIFNRPASSGVYAFVANLEVDMIGFNDARQEYPVDDSERAARFKAAVLALGQSVLHPRGALTSTQLPHVVDIEGFVSVSYSAASAPLLSPLNDQFIERSAAIAERINRLHGTGAVEVLAFSNAESLLDQLEQVLADATPGRYLGGA